MIPHLKAAVAALKAAVAAKEIQFVILSRCCRSFLFLINLYPMFRQAFGLSCTRGSASYIAAAIKKDDPSTKLAHFCHLLVNRP